MKFSEFDKQMRVYENFLDKTIEPNTYFVARLDGRGFSNFTENTLSLEKPFSDRFKELMVLTTLELMNSGFEVIYGYTQSDEISLLFKKDTTVFSRKVRKYNSTLAGTASAVMSMMTRHIATFDCRIIPVPNIETVIDYFRWRQEDCQRNALNGYCYWELKKSGSTSHAADSRLRGLGYDEKVKLLLGMGIDWNDVPQWQKNGIGFSYSEEKHDGLNPITGETNSVTRRTIDVKYDLPAGKDYGALIESIINKDSEHSQDTEEIHII